MALVRTHLRTVLHLRSWPVLRPPYIILIFLIWWPFLIRLAEVHRFVLDLLELIEILRSILFQILRGNEHLSLVINFFNLEDALIQSRVLNGNVSIEKCSEFVAESGGSEEDLVLFPEFSRLLNHFLEGLVKVPYLLLDFLHPWALVADVD